jgi:hypothetical protein
MPQSQRAKTRRQFTHARAQRHEPKARSQSQKPKADGGNGDVETLLERAAISLDNARMRGTPGDTPDVLQHPIQSLRNPSDYPMG